MFDSCQTEEESKKLYRRLSLHLHPDHGGEHDLFILLTNAYELHIKYINDIKNIVDNIEKGPRYIKTIFDIEEEDQALEIIDEILQYAKTHKRFDPSFVESIQEYLEENGKVTSNQYNKLVNIYYSFRMDKIKENK